MTSTKDPTQGPENMKTKARLPRASKRTQYIRSLTAAIDSFFRDLIAAKGTFKQLLLQRESRVYQSPYYSMLSRTDKAYLSGFFEARMSAVFTEKLVHGILVAGSVYSSWDTYPEEVKQEFREDSDTAASKYGQGFYWKNSIVPFAVNLKNDK